MGERRKMGAAVAIASRQWFRTTGTACTIGCSRVGSGTSISPLKDRTKRSRELKSLSRQKFFLPILNLLKQGDCSMRWYWNDFNDFTLWVASFELTRALCFVLWLAYVDYLN